MTNLETIEAKPREIVFKQYVKKHARDIEQNPFWHQPNQWYRWLVKLECECITEVLTRGDETPPTEWDYDTRRLLGEEPIYKQTWVGHPGGQHMCILGDKYDYRESRQQNPFPSGCCEPPGYIWCAKHDEKRPWQEIAQWIARKKVLQVESGRSIQLWSVKLSCGHCGTVSTEVEWSPGIPPHLDVEFIERIKTVLLPRFEKRWEETRDETMRDQVEWYRAEIEFKGNLVCKPPINEECGKCAYLRRIVNYRKIGKLADKPLPPAPEPKPKPTAEEIKAEKLAELSKVEESLKRLERKAERLRRETE